jgi:hypothetical protein
MVLYTGAKKYIGEKDSLSILLGKLNIHMLKIETCPLHHTLYKNKLQIDQDLDIIVENMKLFKEDRRETLQDINIDNKILK